MSTVFWPLPSSQVRMGLRSWTCPSQNIKSSHAACAGLTALCGIIFSCFRLYVCLFVLLKCVHQELCSQSALRHRCSPTLTPPLACQAPAKGEGGYVWRFLYRGSYKAERPQIDQTCGKAKRKQLAMKAAHKSASFAGGVKKPHH